MTWFNDFFSGVKSTEEIVFVANICRMIQSICTIYKINTKLNWCLKCLWEVILCQLSVSSLESLACVTICFQYATRAFGNQDCARKIVKNLKQMSAKLNFRLLKRFLKQLWRKCFPIALLCQATKKAIVRKLIWPINQKQQTLLKMSYCMVRRFISFMYIQVAYYSCLYNNATSVCIFIGCWPWSIKGHAVSSVLGDGLFVCIF